MFDWLLKKEMNECYMCGEFDELQEYITGFIHHGEICSKCIAYYEITEKPKRDKENIKWKKEKLERQFKWRKNRDKNV